MMESGGGVPLMSLEPNQNDTDLEILKKRQKVREAIQILRSKSVMKETNNGRANQAPYAKKQSEQ